MASHPVLPVLTLLVWLPALGALVSTVAGEARAPLRRSLALGFAVVSLALASFLALTLEPGGNFRELRQWVPALGLSYDLSLDGFGSLVTLWVALLSVLALGSGDSRGLGRRATGLIFLVETALMGLATAADGVLLLAFYGLGLLSLTILLGRAAEMKKFFFFQSAGMTLAAGYVALSYHLTQVQTGFPSAEIGRFASLVRFPDLENRMLLLGAFVVAFAAPLFPLTSWTTSAPRSLAIPERVLLLGGWSLASTLFFVRAVAPSSPRILVDALTVMAALSVVYGGLGSRRSWTALLVGFQGLVFLGLLSPTTPGVAVGRAGMLHAALVLSAITFWKGDDDEPRGPALAGGIAALLCLLPFLVVLREQWSRGPAVAALAGLGVVLMAYRLVRTLPPLPRKRGLLLLPIFISIWVLWFAVPSKLVPLDSTETAIEEEE
jgi:NADH-quinone oxidoreductase subunit M